MIDWFGVFATALWIAGLAFLLALLGLARSSQDQSARQVLAQPIFRAATAGGLVLFALGILLSLEFGWEKLGWVIVTLLSLWEGITAWNSWRASRRKA